MLDNRGEALTALNALVIEADAQWRLMLTDVLREAGWQVSSVAEQPATLKGYALIVWSLAQNFGRQEPGEWPALRERLAIVDLTARCLVIVPTAEPEMSRELAAQHNVLAVLDKETFTLDAFRETVQRAVIAARRPQILIVEDDSRWRAIYEDILIGEGCLTYYAASYGEARGWLQHAAFAMAVVDLHLSSSVAPQDNLDGFGVLRLARQQGIPTIVVSAMGALEDIDRAYEEYGIFAFVEKEGFDRRAFARLVAAAVRLPPSPPAATAAVETLLNTLTDRERQVLELLAKGYTNRQISAELMITPNTVKKHVDHILQKLEVGNRAAAVAVALRAAQR